MIIFNNNVILFNCKVHQRQMVFLFFNKLCIVFINSFFFLIEIKNFIFKFVFHINRFLSYYILIFSFLKILVINNIPLQHILQIIIISINVRLGKKQKNNF